MRWGAVLSQATAQLQPVLAASSLFSRPSIFSMFPETSSSRVLIFPRFSLTTSSNLASFWFLPKKLPERTARVVVAQFSQSGEVLAQGT